MSKPDGSASAVVVSGGKQYRVAPGDRVLVDRLAAEPGSSFKFGRVLLVHDGDTITVGAPLVDIEVEAKVIGHERGPRIETLRYKSKKRVRVHRGGRADLTALEILSVGGSTAATKPKPAAEPADKSKKAAAKPKSKAKVGAEVEVEAEVEAATAVAEASEAEKSEEALAPKRAASKPKAEKQSKKDPKKDSK